MDKIQIGPIEARHIEPALDLLPRLLTSDRELNGRYLSWKFQANTDIRNSMIVVAEFGGRVIGLCGFMSQRWTMDGGATIVSIPNAGDSVVAEDFESRGLVKSMRAYASSVFGARGVHWMVNTSANPAVRLRSLRAGWRALPPNRVLVRGSAASPVRIPAETSRDGLVIRASGSLPLDAMAELGVKTARPGKMTVVRDLSYFGWRHASPIAQFRYLAAHRGSELVGFLVLGRSWRAQSGAMIVDWCAEDDAVLANLFSALRVMVPDALYMWANALPDAIIAMLSTQGFRMVQQIEGRKRRYAPSMLLIATDSPASYGCMGHDLLDAGSWDFRLIDSDVI